ncbi:hypothetical protein KVT40_006407 [Elsinoe batatas]|uniref:Uncharacterized protein n=1 Tax=Elsinoe batatas TaxID=2601811 RepID=A0A8K0KXL5_9PEZI|nr:hypothetical protein KVT40_006407 [Elsinoe batatas]
MAPKDVKSNPTALGDPVSLKAEKSDNEPTDKDKPNKQSGDKKSLKQIAEEKLKTNPSALGDPVSLKAEKSDNHPTDNDLGAKGGKSKL